MYTYEQIDKIFNTKNFLLFLSFKQGNEINNSNYKKKDYFSQVDYSKDLENMKFKIFKEELNIIEELINKGV